MRLKDDPKAYAIMGCAMRVHDTLGNGFLESTYADALELEFMRNSIPYVREDEVYIYYGNTRLQTRYRNPLSPRHADSVCAADQLWTI